MRFNVQEIMRTPEIAALLKSRNILFQLRTIRRVMDDLVGGVLDDTLRAAQEADFLVLPITECGGTDIATRRGIPMAHASFSPMFPPTRAFPSFFLPFQLSLGGRYNLLDVLAFHARRLALPGRIVQPLARRPLQPAPLAFDAGNARCPPRFRTRRGCIAYSPQVLPKPPDWEDIHHVTGYWFLDSPPDWQPSAGAGAFSGKRPAAGVHRLRQHER